MRRSMQTFQGQGGYPTKEPVMNQHGSTVVDMMKRQTNVIDRLAIRVSNVGMNQSGYDDYDNDNYYDDGNYPNQSYQGYDEGFNMAPAHGPMRTWGRMRGRPMRSPVGTRGRPYNRGTPMAAPRRGVGPRGPRGLRGGRTRGPPSRGHNSGGQTDSASLKQYIIYLETMKKNMPLNQDNLAVYCPACSYQAKNNLDFTNHHKHRTHLAQMAKVSKMPSWIERQVNLAMEQIVEQRLTQKTLTYCEACDQKLPVSYSDHKNLEIHRIRSTTVKVGCLVCNTAPFKNFTEYKAHCESELHVEKNENFQDTTDDQMDSCTQLKDFPPHKEGLPYGQRRVKEVDGLFCVLCKTFFYTEEEAVLHTTRKTHFNNIRDLFFVQKAKSTDPIDMGDYPDIKTDENSVDSKDEKTADEEKMDV